MIIVNIIITSFWETGCYKKLLNMRSKKPRAITSKVPLCKRKRVQQVLL